MSTDRFLRKLHRIVSGLFLLSMIPAGIVGATGNAESPWIYTPLPFLFTLIITGTYMLVKPWVVKMRKRTA